MEDEMALDEATALVENVFTYDPEGAALEAERIAFNRRAGMTKHAFLKVRGRILEVLAVLPDGAYLVKGKTVDGGTHYFAQLKGKNDYVWDSLMRQVGLMRHPLLVGSRSRRDDPK